MPDRDWSKELAKIDRQLGSLSDESLAQRAVTPPTQRSPGAAEGQSTARGSGSGGAGGSGPRSHAARFGVLARLGLSVALGIGMLFWPYQSRCGAGLALYLGAVSVVIGSGIWSAVWSWRHRAGRAHAIALALLLWGLVLGSLEVLPRVGYAKPSANHPATWACQ